MKEIITIIVISYFIFIGIRSLFAFIWIIRMSNVAETTDGLAEWYVKWNAVNAILNPRHWLKWTTWQWVKYQKHVA